MNLRHFARLAHRLVRGQSATSAPRRISRSRRTPCSSARASSSATACSVFNVYGFVDLRRHRSNFHPFHFIAEIAAMLAVRSGSHTLFAVRLQRRWKGPTPWHARGTGSFEIGFVFTITIQRALRRHGRRRRSSTLLRAPSTCSRLVDGADQAAQLARRASDRAASRSACARCGSSRSQATLVLHPFGTLEIAQKVVPLNVAIQPLRRVHDRQTAASSASSTSTWSARSPPRRTPSHEEFAPAQFFDMTDAEKLSRPSFDHYDAGVGRRRRPGAAAADFMRARDVAYEVVYVPEHQPVRVRSRIPGLAHASRSKGSAAVAQSPLSRAKRAASRARREGH